MQVRKRKDELGYNEMEFENNGVVFRIFYGGNGDLYWKIIDKNETEKDKVYFSITKENYEIFQMFEELYTRIENCDVYRVNSFEEELCDTAEEREELHKRTKKLNEDLENQDCYESLCTDDFIVWHSDDAPFGQGTRLNIYQSRTRDSFLIVITKLNKEKEDFSVEISNSGSRYTPFNILFMNHYNQLSDIEPDYHQIHIEEIMYQKRLVKQREESRK